MWWTAEIVPIAKAQYRSKSWISVFEIEKKKQKKPPKTSSYLVSSLHCCEFSTFFSLSLD